MLKIVNRIGICKKYLEDINAKIANDAACFYIYGCSGSGKSHFLYLLVSQLIKDEKNTVVYLPMSFKLIYDVIETLYVSCMASNEAERLSKPLENLKKIVLKIKHENQSFDIYELSGCMDQLKNQMRNNLIYVIDQTNEIVQNPDKGIINEYLASQLSFLSTFLVKSYNIVLSGSANNEVNPMKLDIKAKYSTESFVFNEKETRAFIIVKDKSIQQYANNLQEIVKITGGLPIEIERFLAINASSIDQIFCEYKNQFIQVYNTRNLLDWFEKQQRKEILIENIIKCITSVPISDSNNDYFDKRIILNDENRFKPITSIAYECIMNAYYYPINNSNHLFQQFMTTMTRDLSYNAVSRGFYVESHLILLIKLGLVEYLQVVPTVLNGDHFEESKAVEIDLKSLDLQLFMLPGKMAPHLDRKTGRSIFFVPVLYNYPGNDFVILDDLKKHLYYFNVTIMEHPEKHINKNDKTTTSGELRKTILVMLIKKY
jgi:hypothetical protein